jgi:CRISPR/Cas system-associated endoribonuclease Cas2
MDGAYRGDMSDVARTLYLVCYDVCEPKRLRRVHRYLMGYKVGGQKSFFECWLTALNFVKCATRWPNCSI